MSDEILIHILSFLPTEDASTTSLLSKRWTSLWLLIPTLDLDEHRFIKSGKPNSCLQTSYLQPFSNEVFTTNPSKNSASYVKGFF
jgi:hypothetical protein